MSPKDHDLISCEVRETAELEPSKIRADEKRAVAARIEKARRAGRVPLPRRSGSIDVRMLYKALFREELGIAELASSMLRGKYLFDNHLERWFKFNCTIWEVDINLEIDQALEVVACEFDAEAKRLYKRAAALRDADKNFARTNATALKFKKKASSMRIQRNINNVLKILKRGSLLGFDSGNLECPKTLLPTLDCVVDLKSGAVYRDGPWNELHFRHKSPWKYTRLNEDAPFWQDCLFKVFCGDEKVIEYFEYFIGFCATGIQPKNFFVFWGKSGDNGKSILFDTIQKCLGKFATTIKVEMLLVDKYATADKPSPSTVKLNGARMAVASEAEDTQWFSTAKVKSLTSASDKLTGRTLNQKDETEFSQTHCLALHTNNIPKLKGADAAFLNNRLKIFPCEARFIKPEDGQEQADQFIFHQMPEGELKSRLEAESSGILAWVVRCACKAIKLGHMPDTPLAIAKLTNEFKVDQDIVGQFLDACCEENPESKLQMKEIHKVFDYWFRDENNLSGKAKVMTAITLGKEMVKKDKVSKIDRKESGIGVPLYCGYSIRSEWLEKVEQSEVGENHSASGYSYHDNQGGLF